LEIANGSGSAPGLFLQVFMIRGFKSNDFAGALRASSERLSRTARPGFWGYASRQPKNPSYFSSALGCVEWLIRPATDPAQERFHATFF
jgi:hypothetical protein